MIAFWSEWFIFMWYPHPFLHSVTSYESASSWSVREHHWSAVGGPCVPDRLSHHLCPHNPWWSPTRNQSPRKRYQHHHQRVGAGSGIQHQCVRSDRQHHQCPYEHFSLHLWVHFSPESSFIQKHQCFGQIRFFSMEMSEVFCIYLECDIFIVSASLLPKHDPGLIDLDVRLHTLSQTHLHTHIPHVTSSEEQLAVFANRIWLDTHHLVSSSARLAKCKRAFHIQSLPVSLEQNALA